VTVFVVVLVFELAQMRGFVFSLEPLKIQFNRLNPGQNLKRLFSLRLLMETGKNILKMTVYLTLAWLVIHGAERTQTAAIAGAPDLARAMGRSALWLMVVFAGAAVVFAAMDQFIVRRDFAKKMRMSRREVRRESRDREGEPRMKQRRKQLHGEFVKLSQSLRGIRDADVLVTNPTHYAVALKYDGRTMVAPMVVSQGTHQFAQRLKKLAFLYGVTIIQNRELARALYARCQLNSEIPEALYQPVADLYTAIRGGGGKTRQEAAHA
jgi:flagellar biosynthetic protein FlhB